MLINRNREAIVGTYCTPTWIFLSLAIVPSSPTLKSLIKKYFCRKVKVLNKFSYFFVLWKHIQVPVLFLWYHVKFKKDHNFNFFDFTFLDLLINRSQGGNCRYRTSCTPTWIFLSLAILVPYPTLKSLIKTNFQQENVVFLKIFHSVNI
jgi:hypothetical protein